MVTIRCIWVAVLLSLLLVPFISSCTEAPIVPKPAEFIVNKLVVIPTEVAQAENITITAEIGNIGGVSDNYTAVLNVDGKERDRQIISIGPSENKTCVFSLNESNSGPHTVEIGGLKQDFTVTEKTYLLQHDAGNFDSWWFRNDPWGQWIRFSPPVVPFQVNKVLIIGRRTDFNRPENKYYTIKIWEGDFKKELYSKDYPYSKFKTSFDGIENEINPPVIVKGSFTVEFISHSEITSWSAGQNPVGKVILIAADYSPDSPGNIGISAIGSNNIPEFEMMFPYGPKLKNGSWIIRVEGQRGIEGSVSIPSSSDKLVPATVPSVSPARDTFIGVWKPYIIQYDSYESQTVPPSMTWYSSEPYGQIVRFTASAIPFRINKIQMAAIASFKSLSDRGKVFTINIWDISGKKLWTKDFPWQIFQSSSPIWQDLEVPNIMVENDFYVEMISHTPANQGEFLSQGQADWLGLGYNKSDFESRSSWSAEGKPLPSQTDTQKKINFCIRVAGEGGYQVLAYDDAKADIYNNASSFSFINMFVAPSYPFDLQLIQVYAYRDIKDIGNQKFNLKVIDKVTMKPIWQKDISWAELPYSDVGQGDWVDIDTDGITCNHDFFIELTTNNSQDAHIFLGCDTTAKNSKSDMSMAGNIIQWINWTDASGVNVSTYTRDNTKWMIRVAGSAK